MFLYGKFLIIASGILVFCIVIEGRRARRNTDTLYLVHILFRHGERTPQRSYPKDIYGNETYPPYGYGELTNKGKLRMYDIGTSLRKRYGKFFGNIYNHSKIEARSSAFARTRMSCELVMASMFQPTESEEWNPELKWQPTLCDYVPAEEDYVLLSERNCNVLPLKRAEIEKDRIIGVFANYKEFFEYLSNHSGMEITTPADVTPLYDILRCQNEMGMRLPNWTHSVFPDPMANLSILDWDYFVKTNDLKRLAGGILLKTIVDRTNEKILHNPEYEDKKVYIYSGHDSNIAPILSILNIYDSKIMPYGETIMIEVHRINKKFIVKVYLQDSDAWSPRYMPLPDCTKNCTLYKFIKSYEKFFGTKEMCLH
ncbi:Phosphatase [Oryctes borbonicus]|uniref:acid phosphatase n=1 Tax=Oryctes borbonicus TaxID=1629725 RepID=A0A0T6B426_9SCAR|nr:Phosphatase [Oryctes borbonicus]